MSYSFRVFLPHSKKVMFVFSRLLWRNCRTDSHETGRGRTPSHVGAQAEVYFSLVAPWTLTRHCFSVVMATIWLGLSVANCCCTAPRLLEASLERWCCTRGDSSQWLMSQEMIFIASCNFLLPLVSLEGMRCLYLLSAILQALFVITAV